MVCDYPAAGEVKDQFLFGDLIVAPIAPDKTGRDVWLPEGEWYGFFDGKRYEGGLHHVETNGVPLYVKAGTLLPVAEPISYVAPDTVWEITLRPFGDCSEATCRLIEDDGLTDGTGYRVITLRQGDTVESKRYRIIG